MSFGEMVILGVIALVVVGPRRLPSMLRSAGQLIGKVRRMAMEIRTESGIDEILDAEGIRSEIDNFRRLATGEISLDEPARTIFPDREREYPGVGCDAYGALSEDLVPYVPSAANGAAVALEGAPPVPEGAPPMLEGAPLALPRESGKSEGEWGPLEPERRTLEPEPAAQNGEPAAQNGEPAAPFDDRVPAVGVDGGFSSPSAEVKN